MEAGNYEEAFRAAHTIMGVCQNLSFTKLYESSHLLTENLRAGYGADTDELVQRVEADYHQTMAAIEELQTGNPA